jgi:hypothetical protein
MEKIDLFTSSMWKKRIDPLEWDKHSFISDIAENYRRDPFRNEWDKNASTFHHCYGDWNNPKFINYDTEKLMRIYGSLINEFISQLPLKQKPIYRYMVVNVTANKGGQYMNAHDHIYEEKNWSCVYSCIHYVTFKEHQSNTIFYNPASFNHCANTISCLTKFLDMNDIRNSEYAETYTVPTKEDDFIIFPSYLRHKVEGNWKEKSPDDFRITSVVNIDFCED